MKGDVGPYEVYYPVTIQTIQPLVIRYVPRETLYRHTLGFVPIKYFLTFASGVLHYIHGVEHKARHTHTHTGAHHEDITPQRW